MSTSLLVTGKLFSVNPPEQKKENFKVRTFILEVSESTAAGQVYYNHIGLQLVNDKCALLDNVAPGSQITAHFNLRGNLYEGKAITNLQAWKIDVVAPAYQQPQQPQYGPAPQPQYQQPAYPPQQPYAPQPQAQPYQPAPQQGGWQQPTQAPQYQQPAQPGAPTWGNQQSNNNSGLPF